MQGEPATWNSSGAVKVSFTFVWRARFYRIRWRGRSNCWHSTRSGYVRLIIADESCAELLRLDGFHAVIGGTRQVNDFVVFVIIRFDSWLDGVLLVQHRDAELEIQYIRDDVLGQRRELVDEWASHGSDDKLLSQIGHCIFVVIDQGWSGITNLKLLCYGSLFNSRTYGLALTISWRSRWAARLSFPLPVVWGRKQRAEWASSQRIARFSVRARGGKQA